ncbi:MAG: hypothetical protein INF44_00165 [Thalassospira sp.]|nr:hypothetical protein [Thalassospira sp.]
MSISYDNKTDRTNLYLEILETHFLDVTTITYEKLPLLDLARQFYKENEVFRGRCKELATKLGTTVEYLIASDDERLAWDFIVIAKKKEERRTDREKVFLEEAVTLLNSDTELNAAYQEALRNRFEDRHRAANFDFNVDNYPQLCAEWTWLVTHNDQQTNLVPTVRERRSYLQDRLNIDILFQQALANYTQNPNSRDSR